MTLAEFRKRLAVLAAQTVQQLAAAGIGKSFEHFVFIGDHDRTICNHLVACQAPFLDRKSTRLNSSHEWISYAVFCLKKKKTHKLTSQECFGNAREALSRFGHIKMSKTIA